MPPPALVLFGIVSVQVGAGLAAKLFSVVPPAAVTGVRLWSAALIMSLLGARGLGRALRGLLRRRARADAAVVVAFGLTLAVMNFAIYQSFARIPLGIAVTVEFLGPLGVAVATSRRWLDAVWVLLAGSGVALLTRGTGSHLNLAGLGWALLAAACWATYILLSAATGRRFPGTSGLTVAMCVAALAVAPAGLLAGGRALLRPAVAGTGVAIGLLSSIIPYSLELEALRRTPAKVFGIWMSLEPAVAALVGLALLGQGLRWYEWAAIGCVVVASAGAARTGN